MSFSILPRRKKMRDFVRIHEAPAPPGVVLKRVRVRVYEARGLLPVVVLSASEDPVEHTTPDIERIAAEVVLEAFPEQAARAKRHDPWFLLIEHLPASYDDVRWPASEDRRRERFQAVGFEDWRVTLGGRRRVRDPERALKENTGARYGAPLRVTLGRPIWGRRLAEEDVERDAGMTLDDTLDASPGGALPSVSPNPEPDLWREQVPDENSP